MELKVTWRDNEMNKTPDPNRSVRLLGYIALYSFIYLFDVSLLVLVPDHTSQAGLNKIVSKGTIVQRTPDEI